ncbi:unnamed protein product, partial [Prorocentrum cordatum]
PFWPKAAHGCRDGHSQSAPAAHRLGRAMLQPAVATSALRACALGARAAQHRPAAAAAERLAVREAYRRLALQLPLQCSTDDPEVTAVRRALAARSAPAPAGHGERRAGRGSPHMAPWAGLAAPARVVYRVE